MREKSPLGAKIEFFGGPLEALLARRHNRRRQRIHAVLFYEFCGSLDANVLAVADNHAVLVQASVPTQQRSTQIIFPPTFLDVSRETATFKADCTLCTKVERCDKKFHQELDVFPCLSRNLD